MLNTPFLRISWNRWAQGGSYYAIMQLSRSVPGGFELMLHGEAGAEGEAKE